MSLQLERARSPLIDVDAAVDRGLASNQLLLLNQGGGMLFRDLVLASVKSFSSVKYLCGTEPGLTADRLEIKLMPLPSKASALSRIRSWVSYVARATRYVLAAPVNSVCVIATNPPAAPLIGYVAKRLRRHRIVLLYYDIYPEAMEHAGYLRPGHVISRLWRLLNWAAITTADRVVTIAPQMARTLAQYAANSSSNSITVIPTWVDTGRFRPIARNQNEFAARNGLLGKVVVMYAGNLGQFHDLSLIPQLAAHLRDEPRIVFVIVGEGTSRPGLEMEVAKRNLTNVKFLGFQPEEQLPQMLAAADVAIVSLAEGAEGISMPSKTYYAMASGSALLGLSHESSGIASVVRAHACGENVSPTDLEGAAAAMRAYVSDPDLLNLHCRNARLAAETYYSSDVCVPKFLELLRSVA